MTYLQFNLLYEAQKMRMIWKKGTLVAERLHGHYKYLLYQVFDFYVEEQVHRDYNIRKSYKTFRESDHSIEPYIQSINIDNLLIPGS